MAMDLPDRRAPRLLVVDDVPANRDVLVRRLRRMGLAQVDEAADGAVALELLRGRPYDLVLLDVMMPVLDGYGVLAALRAEGQLPELPVLMVSAADELEGVIRCIELGAEDYLAKPLDARLLAARVRASLERKRLRDAVRAQLERTRRELLAARRLQLSMVPTDRPQPGAHGPLRVAARLIPALEVGGDLVDHFPLGPERYLLALGDVAGKGAEAALRMAHTLSLLRAAARAHDAPAREPAAVLAATLADVNAQLCAGDESAPFVTLFLGIAEPAARRLSYACAGHPPPYVYGPTGVRALPVTAGLPLGVADPVPLPVTTAELGAYVGVVAYSDGVTEARSPSGALFGEARLAELLAGNAGMPPAALADAVYAAAAAFAGGAPVADDIAVLVWDGQAL
jgi:phosphoserine phosphatase RsbU/P